MKKSLIIPLKKSQDYKFIAKNGQSISAKGLVLQVIPIDNDQNDDEKLLMLGFTASRRVGGAVQRNRAKRRLKAVARKILPKTAKPFYKYVIICRKEALTRLIQDLEKDLRYCLYATNTHI